MWFVQSLASISIVAGASCLSAAPPRLEKTTPLKNAITARTVRRRLPMIIFPPLSHSFVKSHLILNVRRKTTQPKYTLEQDRYVPDSISDCENFVKPY